MSVGLPYPARARVWATQETSTPSLQSLNIKKAMRLLLLGDSSFWRNDIAQFSTACSTRKLGGHSPNLRQPSEPVATHADRHEHSCVKSLRLSGNHPIRRVPQSGFCRYPPRFSCIRPVFLGPHPGRLGAVGNISKPEYSSARRGLLTCSLAAKIAVKRVTSLAWFSFSRRNAAFSSQSSCSLRSISSNKSMHSAFWSRS